MRFRSAYKRTLRSWTLDCCSWCVGLSLKCAFAPVGRRWTSDEEDRAEQQPRSCVRCGWEGGGPQCPAPGARGVVLHRWRHHREDRLVEAAGGGWLYWIDGPLYRGL